MSNKRGAASYTAFLIEPFRGIIKHLTVQR